MGDPEVTARLHLFVAETEAKRGLVENAKRHTSLARRILRTSPNAYLEAFTGNLDLAIAVLRSEFDVAKDCGFRAVELAQQSGVAKIQRAILGNMGNLFYELGDFERATEYLRNALAGPSANGANTTAILESLARVHLIQGRTDACVAVLDRIESSIRVDQDRQSYEHRYSALTRIHLLAWQGHVEEALSRTDTVLELAAHAGDGLLLKQVELTKAQLLQRAGQIPLSMAIVSSIVPDLVGASPGLYAHSEQILACALASRGDQGGQAHHDRALRIYQVIGSVPRERELELVWNQARDAQARKENPSRTNMQGAVETNLRAGFAVLAGKAKAARDRDTYLPAKIEINTKASLIATPLRSQGSSDFIGFARVEALIFIPKGKSHNAGEVVPILYL